jgi:hypothetical protein
LRRAALCLLLVSTALAGCLGAPQPAALDPSALPGAAAARNVVHLADRVLAELPAGAVPTASAFRLLGHTAGEPTLGITSTGTLFYAAIQFYDAPTGRSIRTDVMRSRDQGLTWADVSPHLPTGDNAPPTTGDPYIYVDPATDRVFNFDMFPGLTCGFLSWSDDEGDTWESNPIGCAHPPPWDHQTLVAGPPRALATSPLYPNVVYHCINRITDSACARSLDGGHTFTTGTPAYLGVDLDDITPDSLNTGRGVCGGLHGHVVTAPDGTLYLPKDQCGRSSISVSTDDATTWSQYVVSDLPTTGGPDPAVAVDAAGNVYYVFVDGDGLLRLSTSRDAGATWSKAVVVSAPAVTAAHLPAIAAGDEGKIAIAYAGTENLLMGYRNEDFNETIDKWDAINASTWNGYLAVIGNALEAKPLVQTTMVNDPADPLVRGYCGPGRCPGMYDFIDIVIDTAGRPWAAFVDACVEACATPEGKAEDSQGAKQGREGAVATLAAGPALVGAGALPALASA